MRLIDADTLKAEFPRNLGVGLWHYTGIYASIDKAPTIDAVPVVRCKDCKYSREIDRTKSPEKYYSKDCVVCQCEDVVGDEEMIYFYTHFCSYGDPKESE